MTFSIVIPTRFRPELLARTLNSLERQAERGFEVIIVCDGEDPATQALSQSYQPGFPLIWIFTPENRGQASARNTGALAAKNMLLLFLDDDTEADPELLSQHRKHHQSGASEGGLAVIGNITDVYPRKPASHTEQLLRKARQRELASFKAAWGRQGPGSVGSHAYRCICFGLNCSITRSTFLDSGGFDPVLRKASEDLELGSRLYDRGVRFVFESAAKAYHNDTKDLVQYIASCWEISAQIDIYRILVKNQRNPQTVGLVAANKGYLRRAKAVVSWKHPKALRRLALVARKITDATGSSVSFRIWSTANFLTEYWQGVKSQGITMESLHEMSGPPVTVLTFHSISESQDPVERRYSLSPSRFLELIKRLSARDYIFATPAQSFSGEQKSRNLVLTFDDGYGDFYSEVFPHIGTFGLKPIVFLVANYIGKTNIWDQANGVRQQKLLSHAQILEMHRHGVEFGCHTLSHPNLPSLSHAQIRREVGDSKRRLEDFLGCEITSFAYPFGAVDSCVRAAVAEAGYRYGFTTRPGLNLCEDSFCLRRIEVSDRRTRLGLALTLATGWPAEDQIEELYRRMRRAISGVLPERVTRTFRSPLGARRLDRGSKALI